MSPIDETGATIWNYDDQASFLEFEIKRTCFYASTSTQHFLLSLSFAIVMKQLFHTLKRNYFFVW